MFALMSHLGVTLRTRLNAAIWTAIGLLAGTSLGTLFYLGARIDSMGGRIDSMGGRIDALASRIEVLASRMDAGFARVDARFDALEARFDAHLDRHAG